MTGITGGVNMKDRGDRFVGGELAHLTGQPSDLPGRSDVPAEVILRSLKQAWVSTTRSPTLPRG